MTPQTEKPTDTIGISLDNLCIRKKTVYLVYKSISDTELLIAFDDIKANTVDVHTWTVNKGTHIPFTFLLFIEDEQIS